MFRSFFHIETRRDVAFGAVAITAASVGLSVAVTYFLLRGSEETALKYGLLIALIVPLIVAPIASATILEVLRRNFDLNEELRLAAKVAERLAIAEAAAKARQSVNDALELELAERRRVETELRLSNNALESANVVKSRFLEAINREIRTPMADILGSIDVLSDTEFAHHPTLAQLQGQSVALFSTINDILELSQLQAGEVDLKAVAFDLSSCVEDCVDDFAEKASRKGVEIVLDIAPSVPWRVSGDEQRLRQILDNLIGNAVKFTHRGRVTVRVSVANAEAGRIRFDISDSGIGFSEEAKAALFQAFGVTGSSGATSGAGLGLVISQHLVRLMNGKLAVDSRHGNGSVVSFTAEFGAVNSAMPKAASQGLRDARVFLATSRSSTRQQIGTYLSKVGAAYECAARPADVVTGLRQALASRTPFDTVILDMGDENAELARSIQAHSAFNRLKLIALASAPGNIAIEGCRTLAKPVLPEQLLDAIIGA